MLHRVKTSDMVGQRTHPDLATLLPDHLPVLHHVDGTQVDGVVCFVPQPVLITLMDREWRQGPRRDEIRVRSDADKRRQKKLKMVTCLMAVTVMTKKSGSPLVMGLVGVSMIS